MTDIASTIQCSSSDDVLPDQHRQPNDAPSDSSTVPDNDGRCDDTARDDQHDDENQTEEAIPARGDPRCCLRSCPEHGGATAEIDRRPFERRRFDGFAGGRLDPVDLGAMPSGVRGSPS